MASSMIRRSFSRGVTTFCCQSRLASLQNSRCFGTSQQNCAWTLSKKQKEAQHSSQLSQKGDVVEMQFHQIKPESMEEYLKQFKTFQELMHEKKTGATLIGSFTVEIGDQDEAVHIWEYKGGYPVLNNATEIYRTDKILQCLQGTNTSHILMVNKDFIEFRKNRNKMLRSRRNQILLSFSFWPYPKPREGPSIYEMRSYTLKPGSMIEWGNSWARGIAAKMDKNEAVAGYFTHLGEQHVVHHFWCYPDLQSRNESRADAWNHPVWSECVLYTVPLIRHMQSRILIPTPFSPLQ